MVRIVAPIFVIVLIVLGVFAFLKFGKSSLNPAISTTPSENVSSQKVPVTGNPDDVTDAVVKAATDEQNATDIEGEEALGVTSETAEISALGDAINENEF